MDNASFSINPLNSNIMHQQAADASLPNKCTNIWNEMQNGCEKKGAEKSLENKASGALKGDDLEAALALLNPILLDIDKFLQDTKK